MERDDDAGVGECLQVELAVAAGGRHRGEKISIIQSPFSFHIVARTQMQHQAKWEPHVLSSHQGRREVERPQPMQDFILLSPVVSYFYC